MDARVGRVAILARRMSPTLYGLSQSPWTERARWALEHHSIAYAYHEHVPMVGEVLLRRKARTKSASVPLLVDGDDVVMGSFEIARHVERSGRGVSLFPSDKEAEIAAWVDLADRMARAGRAWLMHRLLASKAAQAEALPAFVPGFLRGALAPSAAMATRFLVKKYDVPRDPATVARTLRPLLEEIRAAIARSPQLLGTESFSVADLSVAAALQVLRPRGDSGLGPATREAWTNDDMAREFGDLLDWRDAIYRKHR